jgi:hypothetical protein
MQTGVAMARGAVGGALARLAAVPETPVRTTAVPPAADPAAAAGADRGTSTAARRANARAAAHARAD